MKCILLLLLSGISLPLAAVEPRPLAPEAAGGALAYTNSMEVLDSTRKLNAGDRISFRVVEDRKPATALIIGDSGEVEAPLIGRVPAVGTTCKDLAFAMKRLLEKDYFYRCTVIVGLDQFSARSRGKVYLTGQVRTQGFLELPADEPFTLSRAILRSGGFADFANRKKVKLLRKVDGQRTETTIVDVIKVLEKGDVKSDPVLEPDDVIIVPERLVNF